jgi:hypothetical protein
MTSDSEVFVHDDPHFYIYCKINNKLSYYLMQSILPEPW